MKFARAGPDNVSTLSASTTQAPSRPEITILTAHDASDDRSSSSFRVTDKVFKAAGNLNI